VRLPRWCRVHEIKSPEDLKRPPPGYVRPLRRGRPWRRRDPLLVWATYADSIAEDSATGRAAARDATAERCGFPTPGACYRYLARHPVPLVPPVKLPPRP